jgi:hypothetical protein
MTESWSLTVQEDPETGECVVEFPETVLEQLGWTEGDNIEWNENQDGSFTLNKAKETQWVLVDTVSTFRVRYMVEVPAGIDNYGRNKKDWALDTVTMEEAKEFSQEHVGEQVISHRVVTREEAMQLCDEDNKYCNGWTTEQKIAAFFTTWEEQQKNDK